MTYVRLLPAVSDEFRFREQSILLIRLGKFGDVIFTLPAVHLVRTAFPRARITFLTYKEYAPLLEGFPGIDAVLTIDKARFRGPTFFTETLSFLWRLNRSRFTLVMDFQGFGETGLLTYLSGAPVRWGRIWRETRRWPFTKAVWDSSQLHQVDKNLDLLKRAGGLVPESICNKFVLPNDALAEALRFFAEHNLDPGRRTLFIQPLTSRADKNWSLEHYIGVARFWRDRGLQVLFGGGPNEKAALEPVRQAGFAVAAGTSPLVSAGLMKLSTLVLGGDTGLLHLAVAMDKRVIMLMRLVKPSTCIPYNHPDWVILPPKGSSISDITPNQVNEACAQALANLEKEVRPENLQQAILR
jgi:ADP-heptose:LPS heptosyltransferase